MPFGLPEGFGLGPFFTQAGFPFVEEGVNASACSAASVIAAPKFDRADADERADGAFHLPR
jgi:hypothetical protein